MLEKLPRKLKKQLLGKKISKSKLRKMLDSVVIYEHANTWRDAAKMNCEAFCPHCGCTSVRIINHDVGWPEVWMEERCFRCDKIVAYIDNSPYIHALECKDNDYDPTY